MALRVTVAAFGPTADNIFRGGSTRTFTGPAWQDQGPDLRWDEREKVELEVKESATLAAVIDRAATELGIGRPPATETVPYLQNLVSAMINGVAFYRPADDEPDGHPTFRDLFPVLSKNGEIAWRTLDRATMGDLVRASREGLLAGDPLRPYLRPMISQGGGPFPLDDPILFFHAVNQFVEALKTLGEAYDVVTGAVVVRAALRRLRRTETVNEQELASRNAGPAELRELLRHYHVLTLAILARALATDEEKATAVADLLGYDVDSDGTIVYSREPDAEFVRALIGWLGTSGYEVRETPVDTLAPFAEERLRALAEGRLEGENDWHYAWHEANPNPYGLDSAEPEESEEGSEEEEEWDDHPDYRLVTIREDQGVVDQAEIEAQLARAAADDCMLVASLQGVKLADGGTGLLLIFLQ